MIVLTSSSRDRESSEPSAWTPSQASRSRLATLAAVNRVCASRTTELEAMIPGATGGRPPRVGTDWPRSSTGCAGTHPDSDLSAGVPSVQCSEGIPCGCGTGSTGCARRAAPSITGALAALALHHTLMGRRLGSADGLHTRTLSSRHEVVSNERLDGLVAPMKGDSSADSGTAGREVPPEEIYKRLATTARGTRRVMTARTWWDSQSFVHSSIASCVGWTCMGEWCYH